MAKYAELRKALDALSAALQVFQTVDADEVTDTLADLNDKQSEHETEARQEKIDVLEALEGDFDDLKITAEELQERVEAFLTDL